MGPGDSLTNPNQRQEGQAGPCSCGAGTLAAPQEQQENVTLALGTGWTKGPLSFAGCGRPRHSRVPECKALSQPAARSCLAGQLLFTHRADTGTPDSRSSRTPRSASRAPVPATRRPWASCHHAKGRVGGNACPPACECWGLTALAPLRT